MPDPSDRELQAAFEEGDYARARQILGEARRQAREEKSLAGELTADLNLAHVSYLANDLASARQYALQAGTLIRQIGPESYDLLPDPSRLFQILYGVAAVLYYNLKDFSGSETLTETLLFLAPDHPGALSLQGQCLFRLERYEEALPVWQRAIELEPENPAHHSAFAGVLSAAGRNDEAVREMDETIRLAPDSPRHHLVRGQLLQRIEQHERAITDFTRVLELAQEQTKEQSEASPRSQIDYERNMPARDMADFARMARVRSYLALRKIPAALADAEHAITHGDKATRLGGYLQKAEILLHSGKAQRAIAALSGALELSPGDTSTLLKRSEIYLAQGQLDAAIADLALVADRHRSPRTAIERLSTILDKNPRLAQVLKWRGFAWFELGRAGRAVEDLSQAVQELEQDAQIYLWRGLARITFSSDAEDQEWNKSFSRSRCIEAIQDLSRAAWLNPSDEQALAAYTWLVDLASADGGIHSWLGDTANESFGLFERIPGAREPMEQESKGNELAHHRRWREAVQALSNAQAGYLRAGLLSMAARLHLDLADNYVRLNELQVALDHLDQIEKTISIHNRPLTPHLLVEMENLQQKRALVGQPALVREVDYLGVYGIVSASFVQAFHLLRAQTLARLGDFENAMNELGDLDKLFEWLKEKLRHEVNFQALVGIAQILRDAERDQQAKDWLEKLEPLVSSQQEEVALKSTMGTLLSKAGAHEAAAQAYQEAHEMAQRSRPEVLGTISLQRAGALFYAQRLDEALEILDSLAKKIEPLSDRDWVTYTIYRALVLDGLGRSAEAKEFILQALAELDAIRADLDRYDLRISWQQSQEKLFRFGIELSIRAQDTSTSFDLVERAKARAFIDQLASADLPVPASARRSLDLQEVLTRQKQLLTELQLWATTDGPSYVDYEVVSQLIEIDGDLDKLVKTQDGKDELDFEQLETALSRTEANLRRQEQEIDAALLESLPARSGQVSSFAEVRALLSPV